jgi:hypothetical protein
LALGVVVLINQVSDSYASQHHAKQQVPESAVTRSPRTSSERHVKLYPFADTANNLSSTIFSCNFSYYALVIPSPIFERLVWVLSISGARTSNRFCPASTHASRNSDARSMDARSRASNPVITPRDLSGRTYSSSMLPDERRHSMALVAFLGYCATHYLETPKP